MQRSEVEKIFEDNKESFFYEIPSSDMPMAVLLGGQSACGKSALVSVVKDDNEKRKFLSINGDLYRTFHPKYDLLIKDAHKFSSETQIFSNVFTEGLISEAIKRRCNITVEGTMRNPDVPLRTAQYLKRVFYRVEAYVIAAPAEITQLGLYNRFQEEIDSKSIGRLAELNVHNEAVNGLLKSLDTLYLQKAVDKISIHSYLAKERIMDILLQEDDSWNCDILPSIFVEDARDKQIHDIELLQSCVRRGEMLMKNVTNTTVKDDMDKAVCKIKTLLSIS